MASEVPRKYKYLLKINYIDQSLNIISEFYNGIIFNKFYLVIQRILQTQRSGDMPMQTFETSTKDLHPII